MTAILVVLGILLVATALAFPEAKIPAKIMTVLGEGVPMVAFLVVFITFMMTIISRFTLRSRTLSMTAFFSYFRKRTMA